MSDAKSVEIRILITLPSLAEKVHECISALAVAVHQAGGTVQQTQSGVTTPPIPPPPRKGIPPPPATQHRRGIPPPSRRIVSPTARQVAPETPRGSTPNLLSHISETNAETNAAVPNLAVPKPSTFKASENKSHTPVVGTTTSAILPTIVIPTVSSNECGVLQRLSELMRETPLSSFPTIITRHPIRILYRGTGCVEEKTIFQPDDQCYSAMAVAIAKNRPCTSRISAARELFTHLGSVLDAKNVPEDQLCSWWGGSQTFRSRRDLLVQRYKNSYAGMIKDMEEVIQRAVVPSTHATKQWAKWHFFAWLRSYEMKEAHNPMVSTTTQRKTALEYARGKMLTGKDVTVSRHTPRRPQYNRQGEPIHTVIGHVHVFVSFVDEKQIDKQGIDIDHYTGEIKVKARLKKEGEVVFLSYVPPELHLVTVPLTVPTLVRYNQSLHSRYDLSESSVESLRNKIAAQVDGPDHSVEVAFVASLMPAHDRHVKEAIAAEFEKVLGVGFQKTWLDSVLDGQ